MPLPVRVALPMPGRRTDWHVRFPVRPTLLVAQGQAVAVQSAGPAEENNEHAALWLQPQRRFRPAAPAHIAESAPAFDTASGRRFREPRPATFPPGLLANPEFDRAGVRRPHKCSPPLPNKTRPRTPPGVEITSVPV